MKCANPLYRVTEDDYHYLASIKRLKIEISPATAERLNKYGGIMIRTPIPELRRVLGQDWLDEHLTPIGCGKCPSCRLQKANEWSLRCRLEAEQHEHNYFLTLTYDDMHLPNAADYGVDAFVDFNGELVTSCLDRSHVVDFVKRLRDRVSNEFGVDGLRVFYSGEYGDRYGRPHYHILLMGMPDLSKDLTFLFARQVKGVRAEYFNSSLMNSCWHSRHNRSTPMGFAVLSDCTPDSIAYTTRYTLKKQSSVDMFHVEHKAAAYRNDGLNVVPLPNYFSGQSRRPGIAATVYEQYKEDIAAGRPILTRVGDDVVKTAPPDYFDRLFKLEDPDTFALISERRKALCLDQMRVNRKLTSLTPDQMIIESAAKAERTLAHLKNGDF